MSSKQLYEIRQRRRAKKYAGTVSTVRCEPRPYPDVGYVVANMLIRFPEWRFWTRKYAPKS